MEENNQAAAMTNAAELRPTPTLSPREKMPITSIKAADACVNKIKAAEEAPEDEADDAEDGEGKQEEGENNSSHGEENNNNNAAESGDAADAVEEAEAEDSDSAETEKEDEEEEEDATPPPPTEEEAPSDPVQSTEAENDAEEGEEGEDAGTPSETADADAEESAAPPPPAETPASDEEIPSLDAVEIVVDTTATVTTAVEETAVGVELSVGSILDPSASPEERTADGGEQRTAEEEERSAESESQVEDFSGLELRIDIHTESFNSPRAAGGDADLDADLDLDLDSDGDSDSEEEDDLAEHEPLDTSGEHHHSNEPRASFPSVALTMTYPVNDMEVVTNRGGRAGSLSKFLDDADLYRRRSLTSYNDDPLSGLHEKKLTLAAFLDMAIDPILEVLDDADSDVRLWLLQSETVEAVLQEFVKPPVFSGEPHEEYGYYKHYFICSEIIMKLYTGEDDLYESFSSDSSSGSASVNTVFGCQEASDLNKWELLYAIFENQAPLDEMQLLFFSKALVRLHDGFCLEDGYVTNVLRRFLPRVMPHLYSNTIKYMLTLILQSYESVHPITGRNDAMEIVVPLLAQATRLHADDALNPAAVENASHLLVDMLQANQADRLGAFCRREGGVYLSKYFVRDQFGTIRGFESMTHGYHNFLQFMFLEELAKWPAILNDIFENALFELQEIQNKKIHEMPGCLNVQVATELLLLFKKHGAELAASSDEDSSSGSAEMSPVNANPYSDSYPGSPRQSGHDVSMYNLRSLSRAESLWSSILNVATSTAERFCAFLNTSLPSSVEIALAKHLHALVHLNNADLDLELHKGGLMQRYLLALEQRPSFDMLLIHIVPAIAYIIKDADSTRSRDNWLTLDLFDEVDGASSLPQLIVRADEDIPTLKIYAGLLKDVIDEVLLTKSPTQNNITLQRMCKRCPPWGSPRYSRRSSSSPKLDRQSSITSPSPVSPEQEAVSAPSPAPSTLPSSPEEGVLPSPVEDPATSTSSPPPAQPEERTSTIRRLSARKLSRSSSQRNSEKLSPDQLPAAASPAPAHEGESGEAETGKKSTHYIKQMLQTPVFRGSMRLGSVIKPPEKSPRNSDVDQSSNQPSQRGSFGWNSVLKRLRKSFVSTGQGDKSEKKLLAIANEPYVPATVGQATQADVLVVDMAKGEDVSNLVHRDGGVFVQDVPAKLQGDKPPNTVTSGYLYKSKFPETGQRNLWERYYFVLDRHDGLLSYYVSESHAKDRTFLRGTARPVSVTEGIPVSANGQHSVYGFQINTQGHGAFMVVVDSIDTRLVWLSEIVTCVSLLTPQVPQKRLSLVGDESAAAAAKMLANGGKSWSKQQLKELVVDYYKNLFGPNLRFTTPMDAPASFWMEEKIDPVAESCVLSSNLPDCVPYWGEFHGYKRLCDFWKIRDETVERSSGRVLRIVVDEDEETAVVMTSTTYRILRNSHTVTEESCDIVNMSGGAIISIHCTFDSFRIAEAFRKEGISAS